MSLNRNPRPDSRMRRLTPEQQDTAFAHCQTVSIRDGVRWLKEQFDLSINRNSLGIWLQEQRVERSMAAELAELRENQQASVFMTGAAGLSSTPITAANSVLLANAVFKEFRKPVAERDENRLIRYMVLALKARELEIKASAVRVNSQRFRSGAPGKPANSFDDPQSDGDVDPDERDKMEKAMILVFGEEPHGFKSDSGLPVVETEWQQRQRTSSTQPQ